MKNSYLLSFPGYQPGDITICLSVSYFNIVGYGNFHSFSLIQSWVYRGDSFCSSKLLPSSLSKHSTGTLCSLLRPTSLSILEKLYMLCPSLLPNEAIWNVLPQPASLNRWFSCSLQLSWNCIHEIILFQAFSFLQEYQRHLLFDHLHNLFLLWNSGIEPEGAS